MSKRTRRAAKSVRLNCINVKRCVTNWNQSKQSGAGEKKKGGGIKRGGVVCPPSSSLFALDPLIFQKVQDDCNVLDGASKAIRICIQGEGEDRGREGDED